MPKWLVVSDKRALEGYIVGFKSASSLYTARHINAWLTPVIAWSGFIFTLVFVMICMNVIIRKQWTERERLTYPLVQLPYEMTNKESGLFRNKLMWISFIIVAVIDIINGLHFFFPAVPYLRVKVYDLGALFTTKPWDALGYAPLAFRPYCIGLLFLIPLDINFSCWFFFFFWKAQLILGSMMGYRQRPEFPEQTTGAYISLFFIALWVGRHHLVRVFKSVHFVHRRLRLVASLRSNRFAHRRLRLTVLNLAIDDGRTEPLRYRTAVLGLIFGFALILLFCWKAGMSLWTAGVFFALYLMTEVGLTRIRAEVGSPIHDLHFAGPEYLMVDAVGVRRIGPRSLSIIPFFWFLTRAHYSDIMPHQLEGFNLSDRAKINGRGVVTAMLIATVFGTLVAFWVLLDTGYRYWPAGFGWESFNRLQSWLSYSTPPDMAGVGFFVYGLLFGIFLMFMRTRFIWWPLHPAGYAVSSTYGLRDWWSMFLLTWIIKRLILKFGGLRMHRKVMPLFFGMILGEFAVGSLWAILGVVIKKTTFNFTQWW
jgi:hypothetical protein